MTFWYITTLTLKATMSPDFRLCYCSYYYNHKVFQLKNMETLVVIGCFHDPSSNS